MPLENSMFRAPKDTARLDWAAIAGHPTPWIEVGTPLRVPEHVYRYSERGAAGQLFGIE